MEGEKVKLDSMNIAYRNTNYETPEDARLLAQWYADPAIRHLAVPQRDEKDSHQPETAEQIQAQGCDRSRPLSPTVDLMIVSNGITIGHCTVILDPPHRLTRDESEKVAWFGVTLGDERYRGKGIGSRTMKHLEALSAQHGATCAEAGVFEFNEASLHMCRKLGYKEIGRKENFTYWSGKRWADVRLLKRIELPTERNDIK